MADQETGVMPSESVSSLSLGDSETEESVSFLSLGDITDQETHDVLSKSVSLPGEKLEHDTVLHATSDVVAITDSCCAGAACSSVATVHDNSQTPVSTVSGEESRSILSTLDDAANDRLLHFSKRQPADISQPSSSVALCQETLCGSVHLKAQETISPESILPVYLSTDTETPNSATSNVCNLLPNQNFQSQTDSHNATLVTDKTASNREETVRHSADTEVVLPPKRTAKTMDQAKPPAVVSTPEVQSMKCPVVQSSYSARQIKCRKTGHRRITANGANLSLGQLINAVSESCLTDSLDSTYIPTSSLSSHPSAIEPRTITPVKAADVADRCVNENLSSHFDNESVCSAGSPSTSSLSLIHISEPTRPY